MLTNMIAPKAAKIHVSFIHTDCYKSGCWKKCLFPRKSVIFPTVLSQFSHTQKVSLLNCQNFLPNTKFSWEGSFQFSTISTHASLANIFGASNWFAISQFHTENIYFLKIQRRWMLYVSCRDTSSLIFTTPGLLKHLSSLLCTFQSYCNSSAY